MGRPATKRTTKREAINADMVRKWFGKNGAKVSAETIDRFIAAGEHYSAKPDGNELWRHANFISARNAFRKAKAASDIAISQLSAVMVKLEDENLPSGFIESLNRAWEHASGLQLSLIESGILVNDELTIWLEIAREVMELIDKASLEAEGKLGKTSKMSGRVRALGGFLEAVGFSVGSERLEEWIRKNAG